MHLLDGEVSPPTENPNAPIKPWQRLAALEFSNGTSFADIAQLLERTADEVSAFITSPKGQESIQSILRIDPERLTHMICAAAADSILTLIKIRDTSKSDPARITAADHLLSRVIPKVQNTKQSRTGSQIARPGESPEEEIVRLRKELKSVG